MTRQFLKRLRTIDYNLLIWETFRKRFQTICIVYDVYEQQQLVRHVFYLLVYNLIHCNVCNISVWGIY